MSKKDEFVKAFKDKTGKDAEQFYKDKNHKEFVEILNKDKGLLESFREAVKEAEDQPDDNPAAGLSTLFPQD